MYCARQHDFNICVANIITRADLDQPTMPVFESRPIGRPKTRMGILLARMTPQVRKRPFIFFGLPFITTIVVSSYGLSYITQTRYDYHATKVQTVTKEAELGMRKDRRRFDIREEYFRLQAREDELDDWEPRRVPRPEGYEEPTPPPRRIVEAEGRPLQQENASDGIDATERTPKSSANRKNIILGPDGKPCRACNSKLAFAAAMRSSNAGSGSSSSKGKPVGNAALAALGGAGAAAATEVDQSERTATSSECPPDGEALGSNTWSFLHSAAAYYPAKPDEAHQSAMLSLIRALPLLYPCHSCAASLGEELARETNEKRSWEGGATLQKAVQSGPGLRKWLCGLHNEVNARLGKPVWLCEEPVLQSRWRDGPSDGICD